MCDIAQSVGSGTVSGGAVVDKNILEQYESAKKEIKELSERIEEMEDILKRLNDRKNINSVVKGGAGGDKIFHINGYSEESAEDLEYLIRKDMRLLKARKEIANELVTEVDRFINTLPDSRMRRMITYKYIRGMDWNKVAYNMGLQYTADSCRMQMKRFFKEL